MFPRHLSSTLFRTLPPKHMLCDGSVTAKRSLSLDCHGQLPWLWWTLAVLLGEIKLHGRRPTIFHPSWWHALRFFPFSCFLLFSLNVCFFRKQSPTHWYVVSSASQNRPCFGTISSFSSGVLAKLECTEQFVGCDDLLSFGQTLLFLILESDPSLSLSLSSLQWHISSAAQRRATQRLWGHQKGQLQREARWWRRMLSGWLPPWATGVTASLNDTHGWPDAPFESYIQLWDICNSCVWTDSSSAPSFLGVGRIVESCQFSKHQRSFGEKVPLWVYQ